jgi:hypothetical protein
MIVPAQLAVYGDGVLLHGDPLPRLDGIYNQSAMAAVPVYGLTTEADPGPVQFESTFRKSWYRPVGFRGIP